MRDVGHPWPVDRPGMREALAELVGVVIPVECGGCGAGAVALCPACAARLTGSAQPVSLTAGSLPNHAPTWAAARYSGEVRKIVVSWKDRGRHDLTGPLAEALARALLALLDDVRSQARTEDRRMLHSVALGSPRSGVVPLPRGPSVLLVPVPSSRPARRRRGADLVHRLALRAAPRVRSAGVPVRVLPALRLGRGVADQAGLGRSGRARNLDGAMRLRPGAHRLVAGRRCVVVDDVVTTGATAREAARVVAAAGGLLIGVAVSCATPLHRGLSVAAHLH